MKDSSHYWMKGIYQIRVGRLRYIGKALCVGDRIYQHQLAINKALKNYSYWLNVGFKDETEQKNMVSYMKIAKYLHENPTIEAGTVEILRREICSNQMWFSENEYLQEIKGNPDYYNSSWSGSRPCWDEYNQWDCIEKNKQIEFFDLRLPQFRVKSGDKPAWNKDVIRQINEQKNSKSFRFDRIGEQYRAMIEGNPSPQVRKAAVEWYMNERNQINAS